MKYFIIILCFVSILGLGACTRNVDYLKSKSQEFFDERGFEIVAYEGYTWGLAGGNVWYVVKKKNDNKILYNCYLQNWFDEIHLYLDSYDFLKKNNRKLQGFFSQLRKRDILLLGSTQYFMNVDVRIRRQCKYVFDMTHVYKDLFRVITSQVDGYLYYPINTYDIVLSSYYKYYDTNEIITS